MRGLTVANVFGVRAFTVVLVFALSRWLSHIDMLFLTVAVLFAHYPMSFLFSMRKMSRMTRNWKVWRSLIFIIGLSVLLLIFDPFNYVLFFAIHHAMTEAFILPAEAEAPSKASYFPVGFLEESLRIGFHGFVYCYAVRSSVNMEWMQSPWLIGAAALCFTALIIFYPKRSNWVHLGFGWIPLVISVFTPVYFYHILLYHVLIWIFFPVLGQVKIEPRRMALQLGANLGTTMFFILLLFVWLDPFRYETWELCQPYIALGTYIHITTSFALSSFNPYWLRELFA